MSIIEQYKCLVEAYYGILEMDEYDLRIYVLKDYFLSSNSRSLL